MIFGCAQNYSETENDAIIIRQKRRLKSLASKLISNFHDERLRSFMQESLSNQAFYDSALISWLFQNGNRFVNKNSLLKLIIKIK